MSFHNPEPSTELDTQVEFDKFYCTSRRLLEKFYPERRVKLTSRDPNFMTPEIKIKLRRKNKLMRTGRLEQAGALARQIGKDIMRHNKHRFDKINEKTNAKDMWAAVRRLTGRQQKAGVVDGIDAESLNGHYAAISTDVSYTKPLHKSTANPRKQDYISEWQVFKILDKLRPTATGLDQLPAWFLRVGAPIFCKPVARLFNLSLNNSTVPKQWKQAFITPIPKMSAPSKHADFRPISITPVLTRVMERTVVKYFLYPAFLSPPPSLTFSDQFAFRPTGSPAAAIITLLHTITSMLASNPFVVVICLDFSKAFDTVRHSTLMEKMAQLEIPDTAFNWITDFFSGHSHCTRYCGETSTFKFVTASVIQGSGIGPAAYVANAGDLTAKTPGNKLCKFADDTYLVIPAINVDTRATELENIETWSRNNNLTLNRSKSNEVIFTDSKRKRQIQKPSPEMGIARVTSIKILGVTVTNNLSVSVHVCDAISSCAQTLYALRVMRAHGMNDSALQAIYRSVVVAKLLFASSAWWGFTTAADRQRLEGFLRRSKRWGFCSQTLDSFEKLCKAADKSCSKTS